jgi:hypothetical protein
MNRTASSLLVAVLCSTSILTAQDPRSQDPRPATPDQRREAAQDRAIADESDSMPAFLAAHPKLLEELEARADLDGDGALSAPERAHAHRLLAERHRLWAKARQETRQKRRDERRDERQEIREERKDDLVERRDERQEVREERKDDRVERRDERVERRDERQEIREERKDKVEVRGSRRFRERKAGERVGPVDRRRSRRGRGDL